MSSGFNRVTGFLLLLTGTLGTIMSIVLLVLLWRSAPQVQATIIESIDALESTLQTTERLLSIADTSLGSIEESINQVETLNAEMQSAFDTADTVTTDIGDLTGEDLPHMFAGIQIGLASMQESAKVIDSAVLFIGFNPLFESLGDTQTVPLSASVAQLSQRLELVPGVLERLEGYNQTISAELEAIEGHIDSLTSRVGEIKTSLLEAKEVIEAYQKTLETSQERLRSIRYYLPWWLYVFRVGATAFLAWAGVSQIARFLQGLEMLFRKV